MKWNELALFILCYLLKKSQFHNVLSTKGSIIMINSFAFYRRQHIWSTVYWQQHKLTMCYLLKKAQFHKLLSTENSIIKSISIHFAFYRRQHIRSNIYRQQHIIAMCYLVKKAQFQNVLSTEDSIIMIHINSLFFLQTAHLEYYLQTTA